MQFEVPLSFLSPIFERSNQAFRPSTLPEELDVVLQQLQVGSASESWSSVEVDKRKLEKTGNYLFRRIQSSFDVFRLFEDLANGYGTTNVCSAAVPVRWWHDRLVHNA